MKRRLGRAGAACLLLLATEWEVRAQANEVRFERVGVEAGLSHNSVLSILQDRHGFLWLGTADGLNRYDGREVVVWRHDPEQPDSLSSSTILALLEDGEGALWVGTANGLTRFDRRKNQFTRYDLRGSPDAPEPGRVRALHEDRTGTVWAGLSEGLFRYDPGTDRFEAFLHDPEDPGSLAAGVVLGIQEDPAGVLWFLTRRGAKFSAVLSRFDRQSGRFAHHRSPEHWNAVDFRIDRSGRFWVNVEGLGRFDPLAGRFQRPVLDVSYEPMGDIFQDRDGSLWISTVQGLLRYDPASGEVRHYSPGSPGGDALSDWAVDLAEDRSGTLWVGTRGGLYKWDRQRKPFAHWTGRPGDPDALGTHPVSAVLEGSSGALWVGTYGAGLSRVDPGGTLTRFVHDPGDAASLCHDTIWHIAEGRAGTIWLGVEDGLCSYDSSKGQFLRHPVEYSSSDRHSPRIAHIAEDHQGRLWLASTRGLARFDPSSGALVRFPARPDGRGPSTNVLNSLLLEGTRTLWLGTSWEGLGRLDLESGVFAHYPLLTGAGGVLRGEGIFHIHRDRDGFVWLATADGLSRFDPKTEEFEHYFTRHGLPGSVVYSILEDAEGRLWLGTNRGLARFDPRLPAGQRFRSFDRSDGVGNIEFNRQAAWSGVDGRFYFGGMDGLTVFRPEQIRQNTYEPPLGLTRIRVWGPEGLTEPNPFGLDQLRLSHRQSSFSLDFAALSFTSPEKNRYAYRLDGFEKDWVAAGKQRSARYTHVPPGHYVFRVRGSNNDGVWNQEGTSLAITITPPFWETWWFRALAVLGVVGGIVTLHRYRVARLLEIERLRLRIAGDLHDDVSSDLSGIALATAMVQRQPYLHEEDRDRLAEVEQTARGILEGLRDIVWYINPEHDSLEAVVRRMKAVASSLLGDTPYGFDADISPADGDIDMRLRRSVLLIFKETLHNIARHARAGKVAIRLEQRSDTLLLVVTDDGVGFDGMGVGDGSGLSNMRRRAEDVGAILEVVSRPGHGTTTRLEVGLGRRG